MSNLPLDRLNRLADIIEFSQDAIIGTDLDGIATDWNKGAEKIFGFSADDAIGKPVSPLIVPDCSKDFAEITQAILRGESVAHCETVGHRKDGGRVELSLTVFPVRDGAGKVIGVTSIARDISERKRQEAALRESEERFGLIADTAPVLLWVSGTDKFCNYFNKPWLDFTGRSMEQELGKGWAEGVHPEDFQVCMDTYSQSFDRREKFRMEYRLRRHDGEYRWVLDIGVPRFDQDGAFAGYIGIGIDVTDRKLAERDLGVSNERLHLAMEAGGAGGWEWEVKTGKDFWFGRKAALLGLAAGERSGSAQDFWERVHPDDRRWLQVSLQKQMEDHTEVTTEFRVVWPNGEVHWLRSQARFFYGADGQPERMLGISVDITESKRAQEALQRSDERFRLAAQAGKMFAYEWDAASDVIVRSGECEQILGVSEAARITGQQILAKVHPDDRDRLLAAVGRLCPESPYLQISYRMLRPDHTLIWVERNSRAHFDEQGRILRIVGMVTDITERKKAEEALANASRRLVEALEQERTRIARELHDDTNQRLAMLAIGLQQLKSDLPNPSVELLGRVDELSKQTWEVSRDVQALSHELHSPKLEYLGIVAAMRSWCKEFGEQQSMEIDFRSQDLPNPVPPDVSLCLFRVLQEALHNSAKHSGVRRFEVQLGQTSDEIHLTVSDAGAGFNPEAAMKGRGLGLTSMKERLLLVKGEISIDSQPKQGTSIRARVPLSPGNHSISAAG